MRIERDIKLDYSDVLFRPKRSEMGSRKEVDLNRSYTFRNSGKTYSGVPIMAANMDGVGTLAMAEALYEHRMFTCLTKDTLIEDLADTVDKIGGNFLSVKTNEFLKFCNLHQFYYKM